MRRTLLLVLLTLSALLVDRGSASPLASPTGRSTPEYARIEVRSFVATVARGETLPLQALGWTREGRGENVTLDVRWEVTPPALARVDELDRLEGLRPGRLKVAARLGALRSAPVLVDVLAKAQPDWDVTFIERMPAEHGSAGGRAAWCAHVKNYGMGRAGPVAYEWRVDGETVRRGVLPEIERFRQTEAVLPDPGESPAREIEFVVDPGGAAAETTRENNRLRVRTDAQPVGFWVEESIVRYFHHFQRQLGIGSNSWEDWAQRQIAHWNADARRDAWRLDRIVVVRDGVLPLAGGSAETEPDLRYRNVALMRGFPASLLTAAGPYRETRSREAGNPFFIQASLLPVSRPSRGAPRRRGGID